jgi:hypothetical protein
MHFFHLAFRRIKAWHPTQQQQQLLVLLNRISSIKRLPTSATKDRVLFSLSSANANADKRYNLNFKCQKEDSQVKVAGTSSVSYSGCQWCIRVREDGGREKIRTSENHRMEVPLQSTFGKSNRETRIWDRCARPDCQYKCRSRKIKRCCSPSPISILKYGNRDICSEVDQDQGWVWTNSSHPFLRIAPFPRIAFSKTVSRYG